MWSVKHGWVGWIGSGYEEEIINFASYWEWCHFFSSEKQPVIWFPLNWCEIRDEKTDEWEKYTEVLGFLFVCFLQMISLQSSHQSDSLYLFSSLHICGNVLPHWPDQYELVLSSARTRGLPKCSHSWPTVLQSIAIPIPVPLFNNGLWL